MTHGWESEMSADQYDTKKPKFDDDGLKLVVTLDGRPVPNQALGIRAFKDACLANSRTPQPQTGTWTLTAPDGRTWQADSPLKACGLEQRERVPANVALARIVEEMDRFDAEEAAKGPALETCERHVPEGINSEHAVQGMSSPGSIHPLDDENGVRHAGNCARWHTPANSVKRTACNCGATLNRSAEQ